MTSRDNDMISALPRHSAGDNDEPAIVKEESPVNDVYMLGYPSGDAPMSQPQPTCSVSRKRKQFDDGFGGRDESGVFSTADDENPSDLRLLAGVGLHTSTAWQLPCSAAQDEHMLGLSYSESLQFQQLSQWTDLIQSMPTNTGENTFIEKGDTKRSGTFGDPVNTMMATMDQPRLSDQDAAWMLHNRCDVGHMRRHSVAVGDLTYDRNHPHLLHGSNTADISTSSFSHQNLASARPYFTNRHMSLHDIRFHHQLQTNDNERLTACTRGPSSSRSASLPQVNFQRHRAPSLHLDNLPHSNDTRNFDSLYYQQEEAQASPMTPAFFPPAFIEALENIQLTNGVPESYPFSQQFINPHDMLVSESHKDGLPAYFPVENTSNGPDNRPEDRHDPSDMTGRVNTSSTSLLNHRQSKIACSSSSPSSSPSYSQTSKGYLGAMHGPYYPQSHPTIIEEEEDKPHATNELCIQPQSKITSMLHNPDQFRSMMQNYLSNPTVITTNELTLMILTSKVAQKSYGTEKRFLCPPPTIVLLGAHWWTQGSQRNDDTDTLCPPTIKVRMLGDVSSARTAMPVPPGPMEWSTMSGLSWSASNASKKSSTTNLAPAVRMNEPIVSGRSVSKNLYISDTDEKRKKVEMLVDIQMANGLDLGVFRSSDIRVIICIHHGSTVSLFNRIRSQTVSTRYLGVSNADGSAVSYGGNRRLDWRTAQAADVPSSNSGTCFAARTQSWDPFIIWVVDTLSIDKEARTTIPADSSEWPAPPGLALKHMGDTPLPVYYNQPIVLQCLNTGLVSPVMIIRRIDHGTAATGGMYAGDSAVAGGEYGDEIIGDPVSQLHKVAFQIVEDPSTVIRQHRLLQETGPNLTLPKSIKAASYLSCVKDLVGVHRASGYREVATPLPSNTTPSKQQQQQLRGSTLSTPVPLSWSSRNPNEYNVAAASAQDSDRVVRKRRVSCDAQVKPGPIHNESLPEAVPMSTINATRRRVSSMSDATLLDRESDAYVQPSRVLHQRRASISVTPSPTAQTVWYEDVADSAVWTIVGTDCATYSFWPTQPVCQPVTPVPFVTQWRLLGENRLLIEGRHFTSDMAIWLGAHVATTLHAGPDRIECVIPLGMDEKVPLLLVRGDGVVYRTREWFDFSNTKESEIATS
ncbi:hypothetical protein DFQ28_005947 [Apophysomyces sp. BC1034]|nr:hypothetical protein DFQ28_005947 [Apophysomyces sp. BC1034]